MAEKAKKPTKKQELEAVNAEAETEAVVETKPEESKASPKKPARDLKEVTPKELAEMRRELFEYRLSITTGSERNTAKIAKIRKDIARVMTAMNTKSHGN